jgi:hypothetical protein
MLFGEVVRLKAVFSGKKAYSHVNSDSYPRQKQQNAAILKLIAQKDNFHDESCSLDQWRRRPGDERRDSRGG